MASYFRKLFQTCARGFPLFFPQLVPQIFFLFSRTVLLNPIFPRGNKTGSRELAHKSSRAKMAGPFFLRPTFVVPFPFIFLGIFFLLLSFSALIPERRADDTKGETRNIPVNTTRLHNVDCPLLPPFPHVSPRPPGLRLVRDRNIPSVSVWPSFLELDEKHSLPLFFFLFFFFFLLETRLCRVLLFELHRFLSFFFSSFPFPSSSVFSSCCGILGSRISALGFPFSFGRSD